MLSFLKSKSKEELIACFILLGLFVYACVILIVSAGTYDSGDGVMHYIISRYSWHHHGLFVNDWGKPLFTILSSPFAQLGLKGITFFNILCGLAASWFAYKIAGKLSIPYPYLAIFFTFTAPIYFSVVNSGLTEPLFSLMLVLCIWFIITERYYLSAIVFSFLPFVRAEFIYVLPLFIFYYILKRKYLANFLLPVGTIVISIIGYFYYKRIFWLITENPYSGANSQTYGNVKGTLLSYIGQYQNITGTALTLLILLGLFWYAGGEYFNKSGKKESVQNYFLEEIFLIFGCFVFILLGHTLVWATGIFPTLGLPRYMAPLIPLASIIALRGLQLINIILGAIKISWLKPAIAILFVITIIYSPYLKPFPEDAEGAVIKKAAAWLKLSPYANKKMYYSAPYIGVCLNIDPYDHTRRGELWDPISQYTDYPVPSGSIMIWDSHFGPNEANVKLDTLLHKPYLTLLHKFSPDEKFTVLGGGEYGIWIFQKTNHY